MVFVGHPGRTDLHKHDAGVGSRRRRKPIEVVGGHWRDVIGDWRARDKDITYAEQMRASMNRFVIGPVFLNLWGCSASVDTQATEDTRATVAPVEETAVPSSETDETAGVSVCTGVALELPRGGAIVVDGQISPGEWDDAAVVSISAGEGWSVPVHYKHDGEALLVAFEHLAAGPTFAFPEIVVDVASDQATTWQDDDWWFHASATDCSSRGQYENYDNCTLEAADWQANNSSQMMLADRVEFRLPFSTLGWTSIDRADIGLAFRVSDTLGFSVHWPETATIESPVSWASLTVCDPQPS